MKNDSTKANKLLLLWYAYPRLAVAAVLLTINLAVIFLFTVILALVSGNGFFDELTYLFAYTMCSDGIYDFFNNQEDVWCFIIKILLTVIQMIIFSGALIGFTTDLLQSTFDKRLNNKSKMHLKDHFVFLNWSAIGQNIIHDLTFLDGEKTVVILTEDEREDVINSIDNIFTATGQKRKDLRVFVKKGDPTSSKHLADISISQSKYVGVLLPKATTEENDKEITSNDLTAFKLMLSVIGEAPNANIVVETENEAAKVKIEQLIAGTHPEHAHRVSVFSHNAVMGHVLGRTTINPLFAPLFHHVLSFEGAEFYGIPTMDLEEALYTYNDCIPIVNYDDDDKIDENGNKQPDQLYVLSDTEESLGQRKSKQSFAKPLPYCENISPEAFTLFIFSNSDRVQFVTSELENSNITNGNQIRYKVFSYKDSLDNILREIEDTQGKRKLLLLSDEDESVAYQDTDVFMLLLHLKTSKVITENVDIYVELVNIDNRKPVQNLGIASIILTNKIISLYMLQLLTHMGSRRFFKDILLTNSDTGEVDFEIIPADQLLDFKQESLSFSCYSELVQSFFLASNKTKMPVGIFPDAKTELSLFCDRMDEKKTVVLRPADRLILITYRK